MKILERMEKTIDCWFLIAASFIFFLLRLPSLFEPSWYGDEGIYQTLGLGVNNGRLLYSQIWDNKPPLLYLVYAASSDQFTVRLVSLIFGLCAVFAFYFLSRKLFRQQAPTLVSTGLFTFLFGIPLIEGNIANSENFMLFPILLAGLLILKVIDSNQFDKRVFVTPFSLKNLPLSTKKLGIAGLLLGLAFLFKIVAVFDFAAFLLFIIITTFDKKGQRREIYENVLFFAISFALPIFLTILFFFIKGALTDFFSATLSQNVGYVGYGNKLLIPQGLLILKFLILIATSSFFFVKRNTLENTRLFIFIWFSFSLFNAFFSQRPYTHYLLVLLPSLMLMISLLYDREYKKIVGIMLVIASFFVFSSFTFFGKTWGYYPNYLSFVTGQKSVADYQGFFDRSTPRDYAIASFIKSHTTEDDQIFIWGNNAQVYALSNKLPPGRYTVAYHMKASAQTLIETQKAIYEKKPKYIIVSPAKSPPPFPLQGYSQRIMLYDTLIYESLF